MSRIAIFIPAYNEERSIGTVVLLSKKYGKVYVIDDGSEDNTAAVARAAGASVIARRSNGGYGAALQSAFDAAKKIGADASVFLDGDFQHNPSDIPKIAAPVLEGKADVCLGSRFLGKFVDAPAGRRHGVAIINAISGAKNGKKTLDYQCGFRAFSKKALAAVSFKDAGYAACGEVIVSAQEKQLRVVEAPISVRYFEERKAGAVEQAAGLVKFGISEIVKKKPLFYFGGAGVVLLFFSAVSGVIVIDTLYKTRSVMVGTAFLTTLLGIGGFVLVLIGVNLYTLEELIRRKEAG